MYKLQVNHKSVKQNKHAPLHSWLFKAHSKNIANKGEVLKINKPKQRYEVFIIVMKVTKVISWQLQH
jgi:hypothetical protein